MSNARELLEALNYALWEEENKARAESLMTEILTSHPDSKQARYVRKLQAVILGGERTAGKHATRRRGSIA